MIHELVYTSAPKGLRSGSRGFCTVVGTAGMGANLAERLEGMSGYRHAFPPADARAHLNPINWSHVTTRLAGETLHVVSRVADAGQDYSGRTNKLAHHLVIDTPPAFPCGPARLLIESPDIVTEWNGQVENVAPRHLAAPALPESVRLVAWKSLTGDGGWAGFVADHLLTERRPVSIIFPAGTDTARLLVEVLDLIPVAQRWEVTFSTYFTRLLAGTECQLRFVLDDTRESTALRNDARAVVVDIGGGLGKAPDSELAQRARKGVLTFAAEVRQTDIAAEPTGEIQSPEAVPPENRTAAYDLEGGPDEYGMPRRKRIRQQSKRSFGWLILVGIAVLLGGGVATFWVLQDDAPSPTEEVLARQAEEQQKEDWPPENDVAATNPASPNETPATIDEPDLGFEEPLATSVADAENEPAMKPEKAFESFREAGSNWDLGTPSSESSERRLLVSAEAGFQITTDAAGFSCPLVGKNLWHVKHGGVRLGTLQAVDVSDSESKLRWTWNDQLRDETKADSAAAIAVRRFCDPKGPLKLRLTCDDPIHRDEATVLLAARRSPLMFVSRRMRDVRDNRGATLGIPELDVSQTGQASPWMLLDLPKDAVLDIRLLPAFAEEFADYEFVIKRIEDANVWNTSIRLKGSEDRGERYGQFELNDRPGGLKRLRFVWNKRLRDLRMASMLRSMPLLLSADGQSVLVFGAEPHRRDPVPLVDLTATRRITLPDVSAGLANGISPTGMKQAMWIGDRNDAVVGPLGVPAVQKFTFHADLAKNFSLRKAEPPRASELGFMSVRFDFPPNGEASAVMNSVLRRAVVNPETLGEIQPRFFSLNGFVDSTGDGLRFRVQAFNTACDDFEKLLPNWSDPPDEICMKNMLPSRRAVRETYRETQRQMRSVANRFAAEIKKIEDRQTGQLVNFDRTKVKQRLQSLVDRTNAIADRYSNEEFETTWKSIEECLAGFESTQLHSEAWLELTHEGETYRLIFASTK